MSSTLAETAEPLENQSTSGLHESNDDGKASKSGEDRDQEEKSKSTQNFQKASESVQDNETAISTSTEQNTTTEVTESQAKEAAGIKENEDSRSNGHHNDYPKTADDEIRDLKRKVFDLKTQFGATSRETIRPKAYYGFSTNMTSGYDSWGDDEPVETKHVSGVGPRGPNFLPLDSREQEWKGGRYVDGFHSDTQEVPQKTVRVIPKLNPVEWKNFKQAPSPSDDIYTIDVLIGEPDITSGGTHYRSRQRMLANSSGSLREVGYCDQTTFSQPSAKAPVAGQTALPERIRINSKYIIKILSKICKSKISDTRDRPALLFRPFKVLVFYEEEIRAQYSAINGKSGKKTSIIGDPEPKDLSTAVSSDDRPPSTIIEVRSSESTPKTEVESTSDHSPEASNLDLNSEAAFKDLGCLIEFIDHYIKDKQKYLGSSSCQKVVFSDIWHLFKPGDEVMEGKLPQAHRVISVNSKKHRVKLSRWIDGAKLAIDYGPITVHCVCIDYDGKRLGPVLKRFTIQKYEGEQNVTSLPVYPLRFCKEMNREGLVARGKLFLETAGVKHMHCAGLTLDTRDEVDSQVMIDFEEALLQQESWVPSIENLADNDPGFEAGNEEEDEHCSSICCGSEIRHNDPYIDRIRSRNFHCKPIFRRQLEAFIFNNCPTKPTRGSR
ncbi:hypothetical protein BOTCAL_0042g00030 [Botryotinia calthae]|uniref:DUF7025 domain-containing protein n=1 Tax=Botryotinia calthae TaxID=38488 RepID=A0A4Y8DC72_9HELO|nr:hypothetical protein BOTCAL_0042g00030 [Botryotinia calthae]